MDKKSDQPVLFDNISVLMTEDDPGIRKILSDYLSMMFSQVFQAENGKAGLSQYKKYKPDIVITDIVMPEMDGLELARSIKKINPDTPVILITAFTSVEYLISAIEVGIDRFVRKPVNEKEFMLALKACAAPVFQKKRIKMLDSSLTTVMQKKLGFSPQMEKVIQLISQVAPTDFSVVLQGETGVGKSLVAGLIHDLSPRSQKPFVTVDVGAIPETLIEAELFGYSKGAFTGAQKDKTGYLESANEGTVFFDELENMPQSLQVKLLRAVEERKIIPLGSTRVIEIDIRIICATNAPLKKSVADKKIRKDLFYRLFEFDVTIPPLRNRREDIEFLVNLFHLEASKAIGREPGRITGQAMDLLKKQDWPGNVRELKNIVRRITLMNSKKEISEQAVAKALDVDNTKTGPLLIPADIQDPEPLSLDEAEKKAIKTALTLTNNKRMKAAALLKIDYKRLVRKMTKHNIKI